MRIIPDSSIWTLAIEKERRQYKMDEVTIFIDDETLTEDEKELLGEEDE